jgi:hypothetical protein
MIEISLRRVPLDRSGYAKSNGQYFGIGAKVWAMRDDNEALGIFVHFRCNDLQSARAYVRSYMERHHRNSEFRFVR